LRLPARLLAALAAAIALAMGFPSSAAYIPHVLRFNYDEDDISNLNPFLATAAPIGPLSELTSAEFVRFDASGKPVPDLVTTIPTKANGGISPDGRTLTWHLRHGLRWSDGKPLTSADVLYTYRVATDRDNDITVREPWERLSSLTAPDPYTVVFRFKQPYALFLGDFFSTVSPTCILPEHVLGPGTKINESPYNALPVGAGPFRYTAFNRGDSVVLEPNPYYWRGRAKLKQIFYKLITDENTDFTELQTGELDLWAFVNGALADRVRSLPGKAFIAFPSGVVSGVYFNVRRPMVSDPRVRRALRLATDQRTIVEKIALGNGLTQRSVIGANLPDYLPLPPLPYDPRRAAALLDEAGWKRGAGGLRRKGGTALVIELAIPAGYAPSANEANVLHQDWGAIGVGVSVHVWSDSQFFAPSAAGGVVQSGKFDAALLSQGGALYANVSPYFTCDSFPPNGFNIVRYCNPKVDALNAKYEQTFDPARRKRLAASMQRLIDADVPVIVLYERLSVSAFDDRLRGYRPGTFNSWGDPLRLDL
jgi:peptide/nickel transport system substrate-binding protein